MNILVLNPGSSTLKFSLYRMPEGDSSPSGIPVVRAEGVVDRMRTPQAEMELTVEGEATKRESVRGETPAQAAETALERLKPLLLVDGAEKAAIGCRVVHGGGRFVLPTRVRPVVVEGVRVLTPLAPLHNPIAADILGACLEQLPDVPTVAIFDTAFHRTMPEVATTYALPHSLCIRYGLRRYGFHGISHRYVTERLLERLGKAGQESRIITCHLGNGASLCAVKNGESIDTSMGMTPMEGLVMGTRPGDVDPGLLLYLERTVGMTPETLESMLINSSGLLGLSGRSADVRDLDKAAAEGDTLSELALDLFAYRVAKTIGGYAVALEGLDAIAFAGGIGEHSATMRKRICRRLGVLGIALDDAANESIPRQELACISAADSLVQAWVVPTDESLQIAREIQELLRV